MHSVRNVCGNFKHMQLHVGEERPQSVVNSFGLATPFVVIDGGYSGFDRGLSLVRYPKSLPEPVLSYSQLNP